MLKYKFAFEKGGKYLLKIEKDGEDKWMTTNKKVFDYTKTAFKEGDEIGIDYVEKNGQIHINRVNKDCKVTSTKETEKEPEPEVADTGVKESEFKCEDCGKALKDGKYKKCYTCNKKNPVKKESKTSSKYTEKSPEVQESIKMQVAYKVASQAILVFTGQIADLDTLKAQLDDIAKHVREKI
jgi:hypothetical protein